MTRTWAVGTAFARVQLRFKRFPSLHTLLLCIAARAFALPVEVDSSHWPNTALHLPFTHCINRQVVAAQRPPPPPLPPPAILDFVQAVAACCCLSFPLSCAAVLHGAAGGDASPPIPSPQASALSLLCACAGSPPNRARCTLCTTCHRHPHRVWHRMCRHRCVHVCRHSQRFAA